MNFEAFFNVHICLKSFSFKVLKKHDKIMKFNISQPACHVQRFQPEKAKGRHNIIRYLRILTTDLRVFTV